MDALRDQPKTLMKEICSKKSRFKTIGKGMDDTAKKQRDSIERFGSTRDLIQAGKNRPVLVNRKIDTSFAQLNTTVAMTSEKSTFLGGLMRYGSIRGTTPETTSYAQMPFSNETAFSSQKYGK